MIEHQHWKRTSKVGIDGQHIAIVGYSHYRKPHKRDSADFTQWVMREFIRGERIGPAFFRPIQKFFGQEDSDKFWKRVHFFNFVPESFLEGDKFATANGDLLKRAKDRFTRILKLEKPDKVFVFSRKGWNQCPETLEEAAGKLCHPLRSNDQDTWGTYDIGVKKVRVCGFRHPLYARLEKVMPSVQEFLKMQ